MSILALLLLNGSTAWFASNSGVSADGFGVKVKNEASTSAFLKSYAVTEINYETGAYTTAFEESMESHILPTEDPNGISYSEYKKALAVVLSVTALEEQTVTVKLTASSGADTIDDIDNYISNCISVTTAEMSVVDEKTVLTKIPETERSFVTLVTADEQTQAQKVTSLDLVIENPEVAANETKLFYFIIEYKCTEGERFELISYIGERVMATTDSAILTEKKYTITYENDIEFEIHS